MGFHAQEEPRAMRWIVRFLICLAPIFFLPVGSFPQELNKTIVFVLAVFVAAVLTMAGWISRREIRFFSHKALWLAVGMSVCVLASVIFSSDHYASLSGTGGAFSGNAASLIAFLLFFFTLIGTTRHRDDWQWIVKALAVSVTFVSGLGILQSYGLYALPWGITHDIRFNLAAASSITAAIVASLFCLVAISLLWQNSSRYWKIFFGGSAFVHLALVILSGKPLAVYILLVGLFVFSIAISWHAKSFSKWEIAIPLVAIVLLALALVVNIPQLTHVKMSTTLVLDQRSSAAIAWRSLSHSPVWGTGPQTFADDFQRYRPASFNNTPLASIRFNKSGSEWWGQLAQLGAGFVVIQLALAVWFLARVAKKFYADWQSGNNQWVWSITVLMVWLALVMVYFLTPFNFILCFLWWLWLGLHCRMVQPEEFKEKKVAIKTYGFAWFAVLASVAIVSVVALTSGYFSVRYWLADYYYYRAGELIQRQSAVGEIEKLLVRATAYNPHEPGYWVALAQGYATAAQLEAAKTDARQDAIKEEVQKAVDALKQARPAGQNNAIVYEQTAALYDNLRNLIGNADQLAMNAYARLTELEPTNPLAFLNLGRSMLVQAQADAQSTNEEIKKLSPPLLDGAIKNFNTAKSLQKDFYLADVNIAYALQAQGDISGAKKSLEEARRIKPDDQTILQLLVEINQQISASENGSADNKK
ncbi:MAG: hypothetical protein V1668_00580 [Patescibacteria group bacterium]